MSQPIRDLTKTRLKPVFTFSRGERKARLFRILWTGGDGPVGRGSGYSCKLSISLVPKLCGLQWERDEKRVTLLGLQTHWRRSWSGYIV
jgi:hypothetical protein